MRFWDIEILDKGEVEERIQGLTGAQKIKLMNVFQRHGISARAIQFDQERMPTGENEETNV